MKPCPWCGVVPDLESYDVNTGGAISGKVFGIRCKSPECIIQPSIHVKGETGYEHLNERTNDAAKQYVIDAWDDRKDST